MKTRKILVLAMVGVLASCGNVDLLAPQNTGQDQTTISRIDAPRSLEGQAGAVEVLLDEDVFTVERSRNILIIAIALYLPFLLL